MIDDHQDFHCAISAIIIIEPALAHELSYQWEYRHQIHSEIASWLHQTSWLNGFTGTLLPGTCEGWELAYTVKAELPSWVTDIFGLVETYDEVDQMEIEVETMEDEEVLPKEVIADSDLVLQLLKNIFLQDNLDSHSNWVLCIVHLKFMICWLNATGGHNEADLTWQYTKIVIEV